MCQYRASTGPVLPNDNIFTFFTMYNCVVCFMCVLYVVCFMCVLYVVCYSRAKAVCSLFLSVEMYRTLNKYYLILSYCMLYEICISYFYIIPQKYHIPAIALFHYDPTILPPPQLIHSLHLLNRNKFKSHDKLVLLPNEPILTLK